MRQLILTTLLLIIVGALLLMWDSPPGIFLEKPKKAAEQRLPTADGYMLDTTTVQHDGSGNISYILETTEIRYFIRGDQFELDNPEVLALDPENPAQPWQLTAKRGHVTQKNKKITLTNDVYAWQFITASERNELRSQQLEFLPEQNKVTSHRKVTLTTPRGETSGIGLRADLKDKHYKLLDNVKGVHRASR